MHQGGRLLAVLLALIMPAWAEALEVQILPEKRLAEGIVVGLTVPLEQDGASCELSALIVNGPALPKHLSLEMTDCKVEGRTLTTKAVIPYSLKHSEGLKTILRACSQAEPPRKVCEDYPIRLAEVGDPQTWPLILYSVETANGELVFKSRGLPPDFGRARDDVQVIKWQPTKHKPVSRPPSLSTNESGIELRLPLNCSSVDLSSTKLTQALFEVWDVKGNALTLSFEGALPLCSQPTVGLMKLLGFAAGGTGLALLGLLGGIKWGTRRRPESDDPPPGESTSSVEEMLRILREMLDRRLAELKEHIDRLLSQLKSARQAGGGVEEKDEDEVDESQSFGAKPEPTGQEKKLLQIVNDWWARGDGDRHELTSRLAQKGAKLYVSFDIDSTLQRMVGRTFSFRPSEGPAGWAWDPLSRGEALAVPADPFLFQAGNMIDVLRLLFDGIGGDSPKSFRFYRVQKACRLRSNPPGSDRYQLVEKGFLELADRSGNRIPGPVPTAEKAGVPISALSSRKSSLKPQESPVPIGPSLRDFEDRVRLVFKEEAAKLQPIQIPQPTDTPREALDSLGSRIDQVSADLKKLDDIQRQVAELVRKMESLKQVPKEGSVAAPAPPAKRVEPQAPPPPLPSRPTPPPPARTEPAEPVIQASLTVSSEPAPGDFLRRVNQTFSTVVTAASEPPGNSAPSDYLRRLVQLLKNLKRAQADPGWEVTVVHLQVVWISEKERMFSVHPVEICEDYREARCRCGELSEAYLLQIFLSIRYGDENLMAVVMTGSNLAERFAEGYSLLTGNADPGSRGSVLMKRPAVLQRAKSSQESWRVLVPMEVQPL